jgi:hypothetical protein
MHGWPAYFGAIYLPDGGDRVLLGDVAMGGLAGRLLQVGGHGLSALSPKSGG